MRAEAEGGFAGAEFAAERFRCRRSLGRCQRHPEWASSSPCFGVTQVLAWGSSYYLLAVLATPIVGSTGWPLAWVVSGLSLGLVTAGLVSPRVGDTIERHGGRPVLGASAALLALGLVGMALAPSLPIYLASWLVLGVGMGAGLYDAAFATLGRLYGQRASTAIATLTLFGGFASTVCWPLSAMLVLQFGWRGACLIYAGIHLAVVLPLYLFALPREPRREPATSAPRGGHMNKGRGKGPVPAGSMLPFMLLAATITVISMITTVVSVHLLSILRARDIALGAAVALGALVGPSQVAARAIEMLISRYHHPIWTMVASTIFVAFGLGALWGGLPSISAALVFYGAGIGIEFDRAGHTTPGAVRRGSVPRHHRPDRHGEPARTGCLALARRPADGTLGSRRHARGAVGDRHPGRIAGVRTLRLAAAADIAGGFHEDTADIAVDSVGSMRNLRARRTVSLLSDNGRSNMDRLLADQLKALAHPARLEILRVLASRRRCVCGEVVEVMPLAQATVSQHLKILKEAGLIRGEIEGRNSCYCLDPLGIARARETLDRLLGDLTAAASATSQLEETTT